MTTAGGLSIQDGTIVDFKFFDDDTLLVLWYPEGAPACLPTPENACTCSADPPAGKPPFMLQVPLSADYISYSPHTDGSAPQAHPVAMTDLSPLALPDDPKFAPSRMEVKAAVSARGNIPVRICLLGRDQLTYKVFTLPGCEVSK